MILGNQHQLFQGDQELQQWFQTLYLPLNKLRKKKSANLTNKYGIAHNNIPHLG